MALLQTMACFPTSWHQPSLVNVLHSHLSLLQPVFFPKAKHIDRHANIGTSSLNANPALAQTACGGAQAHGVKAAALGSMEGRSAILEY